MTALASAPGKVMLAGEYAVIDGAEAIMMAVDRRAIAHLTDVDQSLSPFLAAARDAIARARGGDSPEARAAARVVVDSRALASSGGIKLGVGSSAAATVAAVGCALAASGTPASRSEIHALAHRAHGDAQAARGARGSGADVAASVHGGIVAVRRAGPEPTAPLAVRALQLPSALTLVLVWTGAAAATGPLVARVRAFRRAHPARYEALAADIAAAAGRLASAAGPDAAVAALADAGRATQALGTAAETALWTEAHDRVAAIAEPLGAAVKPTGAGGGDVALCATSSPALAHTLRQRLAAAGLVPLDLNTDQRGLQLGESRDPSTGLV